MTQYSRPSSVQSKREAKDGISCGKRTSGNGSLKGRSPDEDGASQAPKASRENLPKKLRKNLARLREQVIISRLGLREQRVAMREQHGTVRDLEAELLRQVQLDDASIDQHTLRTLHNELCAALDELGPLEDEYDEKEDRLNTLEDDLQTQEEKFYKRHAHSGPDESNAGLSSSRPSSSDEPREINLDAAEEPDYSSPEYLYYTRLGEANMIRERLMELEGQKRHFLEIEQERNALGVPLYEENVEFLTNYSSIYGEQLEALRKIEKAMQDLRSQVERQDLEFQADFSARDSKSPSPTYPVGQHSDFNSLSLTYPIGQHSDFNSLSLTYPVGQPSDFKPRDSKSLFRTYSVGQHSDFGAGLQRGCPVTEPGQKGRLDIATQDVPRRKSETDVWNMPADPRSNRERINQWILERLENSRLEKAHHRNWLNRPDLNDFQWWQLVRHFWQRDRAALSSRDSSRHASGQSTSAEKQELQGLPDTGLDEALRAFHLTKNTSSPADPGEQAPVPPWSPNSNSIVRLDYLDLALNPSPAAKKAQGPSHLSLE
ncbi:MAG: hypothetical protein L6R37_001943 [Teloschistes peruensis]|nr:MAG: hypothetical protein L6R37_001943 [Teloschistes peruensis]